MRRKKSAIIGGFKKTFQGHHDLLRSFPPLYGIPEEVYCQDFAKIREI
jgi:hypothetical protein